MTAPAPSPVCKRCKKHLSGQFVQAMGAAWHPDCWRCEGCGKVLRGPFVAEAGHPYHAECHGERFGLRCSVCGRVLRGAYFQHEGKPVCEPDYRAKFAPRCFFCDAELERTFRSNAFGQKACARHDHGPACTSCGRWLGRQESLLAPLGAFGTTLCGLCQASAVGHGELQRYDNAFGMEVMKAMGLTLRPIPPVPLRLEAALLVMKLRGPMDRHVDGITQTSVATLDGRESARTVTGIVVVGGLARDHFEGVLAHEFGHVWLFHERFDHLSGPLAEGFCELAKDRWLERLGTPLAKALQRKLAESTDPVYGDGFRQMKAHWDQGGIRGVLAVLRSS